jgi:hypothetical protein
MTTEQQRLEEINQSLDARRQTEPPREPDRNDPAWWSSDPHLADKRYDSQHPRNQEGTAAHRNAQREVMQWQMAESQKQWAYDDEVVARDQAGNPMTRGQVRALESVNSVVERMTAAPEPVYAADGRELVDPSLPEDHRVNDPTDVAYQREIERRDRSRWMQRNDENQKLGRPWEPYRPSGTVVSEREQVRANVQTQIREATRRMAENAGWVEKPTVDSRPAADPYLILRGSDA